MAVWRSGGRRRDAERFPILKRRERGWSGGRRRAPSAGKRPWTRASGVLRLAGAMAAWRARSGLNDGVGLQRACAEIHDALVMRLVESAGFHGQHSALDIRRLNGRAQARVVAQAASSLATLRGSTCHGKRTGACAIEWDTRSGPWPARASSRATGGEDAHAGTRGRAPESAVTAPKSTWMAWLGSPKI